MAESSNRTQFVAGIFVLCGLILLGGLIMEFGPLRHRLRKPYTIHAVFSDAQNLIKGAPVRRAGAAIGKVATAPELVPGLKGVKVSLEIYPEFQIPKNSRLRITSIGLMGDCAIDVNPPDQLTGTFVTEGETISGEGSSDLTAAARSITDEALVVMKDIRGGLTELNKAISQINTGVLSAANIKNLSDSLASVNASLEKIETRVLSDENTAAVHEALELLRATLKSAASAAGKAESGLAKFDAAMDLLSPGLKGFTGATAALRDASAALEALLKEARSGKGVLYALMNNTELRDNLVRLVDNLRHRGLLFYKDKEPAPARPPAPRNAPEPRRR